VKAGSSLAGKYVLFQRRKASGRWVTFQKVRLKVASKIGSNATITQSSFTTKLHTGHRVRVTLTFGQAAPCYVGASSNTVRS
jgi:hypothetical protein